MSGGGGPPPELFKSKLDWLLVFVPVALVAEFALHNELLTFGAGAIAILPLAGLIGRSTEQLALHGGPRLGGFLNATFGNVTEMIIAIFLILDDEIEVVKASLTGSILGNFLLVLGLSFLLGGLKHRQQTFNAHSAGVHSTSLNLAVLGLLMPALFVLTTGEQGFLEREVVSATVAGVLIVLYACALLFTMVTHEHLFRTPASDEKAHWSVKKGVGMLLAATVLVALMSEMLVGAMEPVVEELGISKFFIGLILIPVIGNAAEHGSAVIFAIKNQVDITLEIAIGSSTQIALFIAPMLVFISLVVGHPMDFIFTPFEVAAVGLSAIIVSRIAHDGESNWLEGTQLLGAYVIIAISFLFVG